MKDTEDKEKLAFDSKAYEMLHRATLEWPCLSIDFILPDRMNVNYELYNPSMKLPESVLVDYTDPESSQLSKRHKEDKYPYTVYMVGGTQATGPAMNANKIYVMKWSNMYKTQYDDDSESDDDPDNLDEDPMLLYEWIPLKAAVNRVRSMNNSSMVAAWMETGEVAIYDTSSLLMKLNTKKVNNKKKSKKNMKTMSCKIRGFMHTQEGYALDWSSLRKGLLASGGHDGQIFTYEATDSGFSDWQMNKTPLQGHTGSVEDLQFSPAEANVLASSSVDKTVKIWDMRVDTSHGAQISFQAHDSDVNVIAWNAACTYLIASGGDEGAFKVWDLRYLKRGGTITNVKWHTAPITSLQFQPREESVLAVSSADNKLTVWDFGVEKDEEAAKNPDTKDIPQQLMFLHQGQDDIKELRFHPYYENVIASTAGDGINLFRPNFSPQHEDSDSEEDGKEAKVIGEIPEDPNEGKEDKK